MNMQAAIERIKQRKRSYPWGITLIELLIVVAISAIIMISLLSLYMAGQKYYFNQNSRADTIEESRMPMAWISRDIRDAQNIVDGPIDAFNGVQYRSDADSLILEVPDITGGGGISYIIYNYDMANHRLMRIVDQNTGNLPNRTRIIAENLSDDGNGGSPFKLKYFQSNGTTEVTSGYDDPTNGAFIVEVELTAMGR